MTDTKCLAAHTANSGLLPPYINASWLPMESVVRVIVRGTDGKQASIDMHQYVWLDFLRDLTNQTAAELIRKK